MSDPNTSWRVVAIEGLGLSSYGFTDEIELHRSTREMAVLRAYERLRLFAQSVWGKSPDNKRGLPVGGLAAWDGSRTSVAATLTNDATGETREEKFIIRAIPSREIEWCESDVEVAFKAAIAARGDEVFQAQHRLGLATHKLTRAGETDKPELEEKERLASRELSVARKRYEEAVENYETWVFRNPEATDAIGPEKNNWRVHSIERIRLTDYGFSEEEKYSTRAEALNRATEYVKDYSARVARSRGVEGAPGSTSLWWQKPVPGFDAWSDERLRIWVQLFDAETDEIYNAEIVVEPPEASPEKDEEPEP